MVHFVCCIEMAPKVRPVARKSLVQKASTRGVDYSIEGLIYILNLRGNDGWGPTAPYFVHITSV